MMSRVTRPPSTERSGRTSTKPSPNACRFRRTKSDVLRGALPLLLFRIVQCIVQDMQKSGPPPLLPLLRSRLQAEVLTLVLLHPDREWTMTELASRVGSAVSSVQREIVRAEQAGVMTSRRVGKTRLVKAAGSPITGPLTGLLLRSFGPRQFLADELSDVPGIESAYLFGSWGCPLRRAGKDVIYQETMIDSYTSDGKVRLACPPASDMGSRIACIAQVVANPWPLGSWHDGVVPYSWGGGHAKSPRPTLGTCDGYTGPDKDTAKLTRGARSSRWAAIAPGSPVGSITSPMARMCSAR